MSCRGGERRFGWRVFVGDQRGRQLDKGGGRLDGGRRGNWLVVQWAGQAHRCQVPPWTAEIDGPAGCTHTSVRLTDSLAAKRCRKQARARQRRPERRRLVIRLSSLAPRRRRGASETEAVRLKAWLVLPLPESVSYHYHQINPTSAAISGGICHFHSRVNAGFLCLS